MSYIGGRKGGEDVKSKSILIGFLFLVLSFSSANANETTGIHRVQESDTLFSLAFQYGLPMKQLMRQNDLQEEQLKVGQMLIISTNKELKGSTIVLDPGHGGLETGAVGNGLIENEETINLSLKVKTQLEAKGAKVLLTRDESTQSFRRVSLAERANASQRADADLFVSIHYNTNANATVYGTETYYNESIYKEANNPYPKKSKQLAESIQRHVTQMATTHDLGVKENVFHVLRNNHVPSVLIEVGFISNKEEAERIKTNPFKEQTALGIVKGIIDYVHTEKY